MLKRYIAKRRLNRAIAVAAAYRKVSYSDGWNVRTQMAYDYIEAEAHARYQGTLLP